MIYRAENQPRDPRSFKSFVQSTSKSVVEKSVAQKAMKSFFPYVGNNKDLLDDQVNGLHMNRRSYIAGDKSNAYYANYFHNNQMVMTPAVPYAQYYGGYPSVQYMMNYPSVASAGNYLQPNQDMTSKRLNVPQQQMSQSPSTATTNTSPDKKSTTQQHQQEESATRSILDEINNDADGFFDAITNTKEAMVSDGKDGEMSVLETVEGNSNKDGIRATKKNKINNKAGREKNKNNTRKAFEESYKRALKSQGDLEKKLVNYFTDYICGNDC